MHSENTQQNVGLDGSNLIRFFVLAYVISWLIWGIAVGITNFTSIEISWLPIVIIILGAFGPSAAAIFLTYKNGEKGAVKRFLKRGIQFRTIPFWVWVAMFIMPALSWVGSLYYFRYSGLEASFDSDAVLFFPLTVLVMIIGGPLQEEFGWRGYALDRLQAKYSALISSVILGVIWATWHLPLFYIAGSAQQGIDLNFYYVSLVGIAIIMTWLHNNTKASILTALLAHSIINSMSELFVFNGSFGGASYNYYAVTQLLIAGVITIIWGAKTLTRHNKAM